MEPEHIAETLVPLSFCFHFTRLKVHRHRHCKVARVDIHPVPTSSIPHQDPSLCLVHCSLKTLTARSKHVRGV